MLAHAPDATARPARRNLITRITHVIAHLIARLNAHIDSRPMPTGRRLGAWETRNRPVCEHISQEP